MFIRDHGWPGEGGGLRVLVVVTFGLPVAATFIHIQFGHSEQVVKSRGKDAIPVEEPTDPLEVVISKKEKGSPSKSSQPTTKVRKLL